MIETSSPGTSTMLAVEVDRLEPKLAQGMDGNFLRGRRSNPASGPGTVFHNHDDGPTKALRSEPASRSLIRANLARRHTARIRPRSRVHRGGSFPMLLLVLVAVLVQAVRWRIIVHVSAQI